MDHLKRRQLISAKSSNNITRRVLHRLGHACSRHAGDKRGARSSSWRGAFAGLALIQRDMYWSRPGLIATSATRVISACSGRRWVGALVFRAGRGLVIAALPLIPLVARMRAEGGCWRISSVPHPKRTAPEASACCQASTSWSCRSSWSRRSKLDLHYVSQSQRDRATRAAKIRKQLSR
jgi:hypothetical protein